MTLINFKLKISLLGFFQWHTKLYKIIFLQKYYRYRKGMHMHQILKHDRWIEELHILQIQEPIFS